MQDLFPNDRPAFADAVFSPCRRWRYSLMPKPRDRQLPVLAVIGLNPSTADEQAPDPTVTRWIGFAEDNGYGAIFVVNLFAWRSTLPAGLLHCDDPVGPLNDDHIRFAAAAAPQVLVCWGAWGDRFASRVTAVLGLLHGAQLVCLGTTKTGQPLHPLYLPRSTAFRPFERPAVTR